MPTLPLRPWLWTPACARVQIIPADIALLREIRDELRATKKID